MGPTQKTQLITTLKANLEGLYMKRSHILSQSTSNQTPLHASPFVLSLLSQLKQIQLIPIPKLPPFN